jgi:hypothetical protein
VPHYPHQPKLTRLPAKRRRGVLQVTMALEHEVGDQFRSPLSFPDPWVSRRK